jgi:hypothetical protein
VSDDATREIAFALFGVSAADRHATWLRGQESPGADPLAAAASDPPVIRGGRPIYPSRGPDPRPPAETVVDDDGWRGFVFEDGASWLIGDPQEERQHGPTQT